MNFSEIAYKKRGPVTIIKFNRPEVRNCIGPTTHRELVEAWTHFRDDNEAKVAIITGAGDKAFCAGGDLKSGTGLVPVRRPKSRPTIEVSVRAYLVPADGLTSTSRSSPRLTALLTPGDSSGHALRISESRKSMPRLASHVVDGTSAWPTGALNGCRGSSGWAVL